MKRIFRVLLVLFLSEECTTQKRSLLPFTFLPYGFSVTLKGAVLSHTHDPVHACTGSLPTQPSSLTLQVEGAKAHTGLQAEGLSISDPKSFLNTATLSSGH